MPKLDYEDSLNPALRNCKGLFVNSLRKVQREVHPALSVQDEALEYIEGLIIRLMDVLCLCQPRTIGDVEDRVSKTFPDPIDKWAISDAQDAIAKGKKKSPLVLPADKVHPIINKEILGYKVDYQVSLYIVAVMEYISADIIKLAGNYVKNIRHIEITCQDIKVALFADKVLMNMFHPDDMEASFEEEISNTEEMLTYEEVVREMMVAEYKYNRDLSMIIKVFRAPFVEAKDLFSQEDIDKIFSNITEIYDFAVTFTGLLDAAIETADEGKPPAIGECFEEMAEAAEFEVYERFAREQTALASKLYRHLGIGGKLYELLSRPKVDEYFRNMRPKFKETVKYCLPKLLMTPIYHCMHYFDLVKLLSKTSPHEDDVESLGQAESALGPLQATLERIVSSGALGKRKEDKFSKAQRRKSGVLKSAAATMNELQRNIEGWEGKDISQTCTEIVKEGLLTKVHPNKKHTERYLFLLDGLLICCKQNTRHSLSGQASPEYRLKEKYFLRKADINDLEDTEDVKNAFEVVERDQPKALFECKNEEEKNEWMACLMTLYMRSTIDRLLDHMLMEEEKAIPLRIPSPEEYCFAVEDADDNIVFEEGQENSVAPVIKGGTLVKLIERLTHHKYADPTFVRTFLTTYRSFCKPRELLELLITRFNIPEPPPSEEDNLAMERGKTVLREDLKRFRKEYAQPVQLRVLNGIRHWVDNHFYDFERDAQLLRKLQLFLETVNGKAMRRWVESINKVIERKTSWETNSITPEITFERDPPAIEWHSTTEYDKFDILTLHPIEIARQLTLLESDLYRAVRPSELVGSVWTKEDIKHLTSPNLLKMIHHTNKITVWFEKSLVEMANLEERVSVLTRIIDILIVFQELNNFNGILEVVSALNSSPIFRLQHAFVELNVRRQQSLDEAKELSSDHYKKYIEKLRSINPPCVPFFGMYLTNILKTEEGNPDFLPNYPEGIINFSKRRKVAEITGEIQQYQNQPYCLRVEDSIRDYLEALDPFEGRTAKEMGDYLYKLSLEIEPRNCKTLPKYPRKTDLPLKSPGTKPGVSRLSLSSQPSMTSLRRTSSQASSIFLSDFGEVFSPTASTFHSSLPRTPLSTTTFMPSDSTPQIPESPSSGDDFEPDYVNIENFPEGGGVPPPIPPPPVLPPRPTKQRATSVNEEKSPPQMVKRMNSMPIINAKLPAEIEQLPSLPPRPEKPALPSRVLNAPPLPPRHPLRASPKPPPPLPPRSSQSSDNADDDAPPPALPPKTRRS